MSDAASQTVVEALILLVWCFTFIRNNKMLYQIGALHCIHVLPRIIRMNTNLQRLTSTQPSLCFLSRKPPAPVDFPLPVVVVLAEFFTPLLAGTSTAVIVTESPGITTEEPGAATRASVVVVEGLMTFRFMMS